MNNMRVVQTRGRRMLSLALFAAVLSALLALPMAAKAAPPVPDVVSVSPTCGPLAGNALFYVNGTGFAGAEVSTISFQLGGIPYNQSSGSQTDLGGFRVLSATQIEVRTTGTGAAGPRGVTVTTNGGTDTLPNAYDYNNSCAASTVTVNPASGTAGVQTSVTGSGFTGLTSATIGGQNANGVFQNDNLILVTPPVGLSGPQALTVNTNHGSGSSTFTYGSGSGVSVTGLSPSCGPNLTSTLVQIYGTGFVTGQTSVSFGGVTLTPSVNSSTWLTVTSPTVFQSQTVDVIVTVTGVGSSSNTSADNFTFGSCSGTVSVTSLSPSCGANLSATTVQIYGTGFVTGQTTVTFGGVTITPTVNGSTWLTVTSPSIFSNQVVDVLVTVAGVGTSANTSADNYTYGCGSGNVSVTSLSPSCGPNLTGTTVQIYGTGFLTGQTTVTFGGVTITPTVNGSTWLTVTSPSIFSNQVVDVLVTVAGVGTSVNTSADNYTYGCGSGTVTVTQVSPTCGQNLTATLVTITGTGFINGQTTVAFGGVQGTSVNVSSSTTLTVYTPASLSNTAVDVIVNVAGVGSSTDTAADNFTFGLGTCGSPTVVSVSPSSGPVAGGTTVTITGTNFVSGATSVSFGGAAGTSVTVSNSTSLTVVSPAHAGGQVDVVVTVGGFSSATSALSKFTYTGGTLTYTLSFRWTLIVWNGADGMTVSNAVAGNDGNSATNDLSAQVTLVARWNAGQQRWELSFPAQGNVPGANDFTTLIKGTAYFVAIAGPNSQSWIVQQG
ncbi:MAG: IPT/TIG domain-containing protein [Dehalococcoidia bacterium]|nr:IPT/TIG domain-containing protein [Dehalococcoidia bacterium]